ncbi:hypothetical protein BDA96_01G528700 [Sorghum bicolor]|uniref:Uncharacterized protein n=1 Tax=Sorghum bicolor TaxID=4558 RepID=A0A921V2P0_SORBI|nr:hypothetical protein BDA96_01G528700 [Sorghum bicolor]
MAASDPGGIRCTYCSLLGLGEDNLRTPSGQAPAQPTPLARGVIRLHVPINYSCNYSPQH